jgi:hypothetical protein
MSQAPSGPRLKAPDLDVSVIGQLSAPQLPLGYKLETGPLMVVSRHAAQRSGVTVPSINRRNKLAAVIRLSRRPGLGQPALPDSVGKCLFTLSWSSALIWDRAPTLIGQFHRDDRLSNLPAIAKIADVTPDWSRYPPARLLPQ